MTHTYKHSLAMLAIVAASSIAALSPAPAFAFQYAKLDPLSVPISGPLDPRIKVYAYSPDVVYTLPVSVGLNTHIMMGPNENLTEKPQLGETIQWRVTGNEKNLYIKALKPGVTTSLSLVTNKRDYEFQLVSTNSPNERVAKAYFTYPDEQQKFAMHREQQQQDAAAHAKQLKAQNLAPDAMDPSLLNFNYKVEGDADFKPTAIYDNGTFTWMRMPKSQDLPAVFMVESDGKLMPVNYTVPDRVGDRDEIIIERTALKWVLKLGKSEVRVFATK
ncbi:MAG: conjugal transfer protein TrbG [Burkholderiaceae bacterium]|nr:MAG: conjugal transfer protein TrbG [Burkholderiaceae bacterium]TBR76162.1 MAG: conjugal transfer protein TrbG [Burkholderiaceae bacterium]